MNNSTNHCLNCQTSLEEGHPYCPNCGQKKTDGRQSLTELIGEFLSDNLHLDAKLPKTLWMLITKPGKLTIEYFEGKHKSYVKPLRLFVAITLGLFAAFFFQKKEEITKNMSVSNLQMVLKSQIERDSILMLVDSTLNLTKAAIPDTTYHAVIDSQFVGIIPSSFEKDSTDMNIYAINDSNTLSLNISNKDLAYLSAKDIVEKYEIKGFWNKLFAIQTIRVIQDSSALIRTLTNQAAYIIFLLMPLFALIMKLIYWRRDKYYVEHLIFSFHCHAFLFMILMVISLINPSDLGNYFLGAIGLGAIYLFVAMYRVYNQSIGKTLLKFILLTFTYMVSFSIFLLISLMFIFMIF